MSDPPATGQPDEPTASGATDRPIAEPLDAAARQPGEDSHRAPGLGELLLNLVRGLSQASPAPPQETPPGPTFRDVKGDAYADLITGLVEDRAGAQQDLKDAIEVVPTALPRAPDPEVAAITAVGEAVRDVAHAQARAADQLVAVARLGQRTNEQLAAVEAGSANR